jgi:hypothetical protein
LFCAGRMVAASRIRQGRSFTNRFLAIEYDADTGGRDVGGERMTAGCNF